MRTRAGAALGIAFFFAACALNSRPGVTSSKAAEIWRAPADLEQRDLFNGPGGSEHAPEVAARYEFLEVKQSGVSPGYHVQDGRGQRWSVKLGAESRTEIVVSRVVWAVGYHQPFIYHVPRWTLVHGGVDSSFGGARFRLESEKQDKRGEWSWRKNPFMGTRELAGLYVLMVLFNNWDLKTAQNAIYQVGENGNDTETWYMVRDLGASLGRSEWLTFGTKDDVTGFERERFITGVEGNRVRFAFEGGWMEPQMHTSITPADVRWICGLLARLSEKQWSDAFRAGGYSEKEAERFIRRLREKVQEGLKAGTT